MRVTGSQTAVVLLLVEAAAYALKLGLNVFVAQRLSVADYGDFGLALRTLSILATLSLLGTPSAAKKFLGKYLKRAKVAEEQRYIRWNIQFVRPSFVGCVITALLALTLMTALHMTGLRDIQNYHLAAYMLWIAPVTGAALLLAAFLKSNLDVVAAQVIQQMLTYGALLAFFVTAVLFLGVRLQNLELVLLILAAYLVVGGAQALVVHRRMPGLLQTAFLAARSRRRQREQTWRKFSVAMTFNTALFLTATVMDLVILEVFGTEDDLGVYVACAAIVGAVWLIPNSGYQFLGPHIASMVDQKTSAPRLQRLINQSNTVVLTTVLVATAGVVFFGKDFLSHFGPQYPDAYPALLVLCGSAVAGACSQVPRKILMYSGGAVTLLKISMADLALCAAAGIPLTILYGPTGTATSLLFAIFTEAVVLWVLVRKRVPALKSLSVF